MQVSAKVDYAMRAMLVLATAPDDQRVSRDAIAAAQDIPPRYLEDILSLLRQAGLVSSSRGASGGFALARPPEEVTVASVARAVDGPLTLVQGQRPESVTYQGNSRHLQELWVGLRASVREVMESVTLGHLLTGELPDEVRDRVDSDDAWTAR